MGLFDKFRKRVNEAAEEADIDALSTDEESEEAQEALASQNPIDTQPEEEWDEIVDDEPLALPLAEDEWEEWDEDEEETYTLPTELSRREKKILAKAAKKAAVAKKSKAKELKRRGGKEVG